MIVLNKQLEGLGIIIAAAAAAAAAADIVFKKVCRYYCSNKNSRRR
jgi:hypothetical protein